MNPNAKKLIHVCFLLLLVFGLIQIPTVRANSQLTQDSDGALNAALSYLSSQQLTDGGIAGLTGLSDPGTAARAILSLTANGVNPAEFINPEGKSLVDYLSANYQGYVYDEQGLLFPGNAGLVLAALGAVDATPLQIISELSETLQEDGSFASEASADFTSGAVTDLNQAFSIIGLVNADQKIPPQAIDYLIKRQAEDGTWDSGFGSDPDTTAIVLIALIGSGQVDSAHPAVLSALEYFRSTQQDNGGWKPDWDSDPLNVDTTGWITHSLLTSGEDLTAWEKDGNTPVTGLLSQQQPDGSIGGTYVNAYTTIEALLGLANVSVINLPKFAPSSMQSEEKQAGLVIQLATDNIIQQCISYEGDEFFGADLLAASNLNLEVAVNPSMGALVCGIEGIGCPIDDCFCDMPTYWSYWVLTDGEWAYAQSGADTLLIQPGTVQGWSWGDTAPPVIEFSQICTTSTDVLPTEMHTEVAATDLPQPSTTSELLAEEPEAVSTEVEIPTDQQPTNVILYYVFGGLLILLVLVVVVLLSKRK